MTQPQKAVFAGPTPSETAALLAPPDGWPDITDELAEIRFLGLMGVDDRLRDEVLKLRDEHPGHPDVESLAAELGIELEGTERSKAPPETVLPLLVDDAAAPAVEPEEPAALDEPPPSVAGSTMPPSSAPPPTEASEPPSRYPVSGGTMPPSSPPAGAPQPAAIQTSDELLDMGESEFEDLESSDSASDLSIDLSDLELTGPTPAPQLDAAAMYDEPSGLLDGVGEPGQKTPDDLEMPDSVDRTMMVGGLQPPAPYGGDEPPSRERQPTPYPEEEEDEGTGVMSMPGTNEGTSVGPAPGSNERTGTMQAPEFTDRTGMMNAVGSGYDDESSATLPPGGLSADYEGTDYEPTFVGNSPLADAPSDAEERERSSTLVPQSVDDPPEPAPYAGPGGEPPPEAGMMAPDRESDSAAASGSFRVSDLGLDDLPDLDNLSSEDTFGGGEPEPGTTEEGTVVMRSPVPPAPYGRGEAPVPIMPVRLVMLGPRGETVDERTVEVGAYFDVGRQPHEPWAEDRRMEPHHARMFPAAGGIVVDDFGRPSGVYTKISDTIVIEDGDEFKVGQARLALQRFAGPGSWGQLTLVRHDSSTPETYPLLRDEIIIGREEGDIVLPNDTFVSGDHCRFIREGNAVYLEDLGSSNGTYIRVRAGQCVAFGGLLLVGHTQFKVAPG